MVEHHTGDSFVKIVYAKVRSNGRTEMVPLKLYIDGSLDEITQSLFTEDAVEAAQMILMGGRYQIQQVLGQGGFGRTYLAIDLHRFNERCVLKEFVPQSTGDYEAKKSRELFEREAKILHSLEHPQIPQFYACFEDNDRLFLVQEYINGRTYSAMLRERLKQGYAFSEIEIVRWLQDLLPVLEYSHQRQIIHRDISPDNIMLHHDRNLPMLIDFGVGKWAISQSQSPTSSQVMTPHGEQPASQQSIVGKLGYAPHEQIWMAECFPSSDLYSLAVTALVLLTGKEPQFLFNSRSMDWHWQDYVQISDRFEQVLRRMLQHRPTERYQSAAEVLAALNHTNVPTENCMTVISSPIPENVTIVSQPESAMPAIARPHPVVVPASPQESRSMSQAMLEHYQQELVTCIGPIAKFLVQETLSQHRNASPEQFVTILAERIPNSEQATEFRRRLLTG